MADSGVDGPAGCRARGIAPAREPAADACPGKVPDNWLRLARRLTESGGSGELAASLRKIELVRDRLGAADPVVCHGDFHPLNVLTAPGGSALHVIDWTNAGVGDRHGDIAWTLLWFEIAAVAAPRRRTGCSCGCYGERWSGLT